MRAKCARESCAQTATMDGIKIAEGITRNKARRCVMLIVLVAVIAFVVVDSVVCLFYCCGFRHYCCDCFCHRCHCFCHRFLFVVFAFVCAILAISVIVVFVSVIV